MPEITSVRLGRRFDCLDSPFGRDLPWLFGYRAKAGPKRDAATYLTREDQNAGPPSQAGETPDNVNPPNLDAAFLPLHGESDGAKSSYECKISVQRLCGGAECIPPSK